MKATKLRLTPEAVERNRTAFLSDALRALGKVPTDWEGYFPPTPPTDEELDAVADACNEILNGIDAWLDDREDARFVAKHGVDALKRLPKKRGAVNKSARKSSNKNKPRRRP